jgi:hypothetical protein
LVGLLSEHYDAQDNDFETRLVTALIWESGKLGFPKEHCSAKYRASSAAACDRGHPAKRSTILRILAEEEAKLLRLEAAGRASAAKAQIFDVDQLNAAIDNDPESFGKQTRCS